VQLCDLTNPTPCKPGEHTKCPAMELIRRYQALKAVTMTGGLTGAFRHVPPHSWVNHHDYRQYEVLKVNTNGKKQRRFVAVDKENATLINMDERLRVKKKLPLVQLIQVEKLQDDHTRVNLIFSSNGAHVRAMGHSKVLDELLETSYNLVFVDRGHRDAFVDELLGVVGELPTILANTQGLQQTPEDPHRSEEDGAAPAKAGAGGGRPSSTAAGAGASGGGVAFPDRGGVTGAPKALLAVATSPDVLRASPPMDLLTATPAPVPSGGAVATASMRMPAVPFRRTRRDSLTSKVLDAARDEYVKQLNHTTTASTMHQIVALLQEQAAAISVRQRGWGGELLCWCEPCVRHVVPPPRFCRGGSRRN